MSYWDQGDSLGVKAFICTQLTPVKLHLIPWAP